MTQGSGNCIMIISQLIPAYFCFNDKSEYGQNWVDGEKWKTDCKLRSTVNVQFTNCGAEDFNPIMWNGDIMQVNCADLKLNHGAASKCVS